MKSIKVLLLAIVAISFSACNDDLLDIHFGLNAHDVVYTLKPTSTAGDILLDTAIQGVNLDSVISANGADPSKVKAVRIKKITASIDNPATANFDILESGVLNVSAVGLLPSIIATFNNVPDGVKTFDITPNTEVNILEYARKSAIQVHGKLTTNGPLVEATTLRLHIEYEVTANPVKKE